LSMPRGSVTLDTNAMIEYFMGTELGRAAFLSHRFAWTMVVSGFLPVAVLGCSRTLISVS